MSFSTNAYFKLNLRLAITRCADDFINYSTLYAEDLMQWFVEYLHTQWGVLQSYLEYECDCVNPREYGNVSYIPIRSRLTIKCCNPKGKDFYLSYHYK